MPDLSDDSKEAIMKTESKSEKEPGKLKLKKETLRELTNGEASKVQGGGTRPVSGQTCLPK